MRLPFDECMKRFTERQLQIYLLWLEEQWNQPDRTDYYLMGVRCEIARKFSKNPNDIQDKDFKMVFGSKRNQETQDTEAKRIHRQQVADLAKSQAMHRVGGEVKLARERPAWAVKDVPTNDFVPPWLEKYMAKPTANEDRSVE